MAFTELGLNPLVLQSLETTGYTEPTEVQRQSIPAALAGQDLLVSSHTGSGKTAAFLLPALTKLAEPSQHETEEKIFGPRLLVLCPTRELALQVQKQAMIYGKGLKKLRTVCLVGGAPFGPQFQAMKPNPEVMIATPGRLIDHLERGRIDFGRLEMLVLDEADRMLDMGFIDDIESIVERTPATRQTLLFSATLDGEVGRIAQSMTKNPQRIEVATHEEHKADINQSVLFADDIGHKHRLLDHLLRDASLTQAVVFTATKRSAEELAETLLEQGFTAAALHGDMPQHKRNRTLQRLRDGQTRVLVATDVAARGIDVAGISHVINFDAPRQAEDYVHRIGRTGRAGRSGMAITLINGKERGLLRDIERYTGEKVRIDTIPGLEPKARIDHEPRRKSSSDWKGKPRGEWQGKPRAAGPGFGRKTSDDGFPGANAWRGEARFEQPARKPRPAFAGDAQPRANRWDKPPRAPEPVLNDDFEAPARPEKEPDANAWAKTAQDTWKKGNSWGQRRSAGAGAGASKPGFKPGGFKSGPKPAGAGGKPAGAKPAGKSGGFGAPRKPSGNKDW